METDLEQEVEYQPVDDVVKARPGDDVQFVWRYKYPLPLTVVDFYKDNAIQNKITKWSRRDGVYDIEDEYKNRATVKITPIKDQEEVTLTLRNVTRGDYDHTYNSVAIATTGYFKSSTIELRRLPDFKWLPTDKIIKGMFEKDAPLVWKYQSNLTLDKIDISRKKREYEKEHVALWTPDEGLKPNTLLSTDVTLEHRKKGDVGTITLTLIKPYPSVFDKQYNCTVYFENGLDSMEIELQSYKVEYQPVYDVVKARPGDDVQFVWSYKYQLPLTVVKFYKNEDIQNAILRWSRSDGVYDIEDEYKNRVDVTVTNRTKTVTKNKDQEEVTLTLRNVTRGDYDHTYNSVAIATTGYFKSSTIELRRLPVWEETLTPVQTTISPVQTTFSTPSSASQLSQVSMFLICSMLLAAPVLFCLSIYLMYLKSRKKNQNQNRKRFRKEQEQPVQYGHLELVDIM